MSEFVNYNKRSVALPPGCKDLMDLLRPKPTKHATISPPNELPVVTRGEKIEGSLSDIGRHIAKICEAPAQLATLIVSPPDEQLTLVFTRQDHQMMAVVTFACDPEREAAMHAFCESHNIPSPTRLENWIQPQLYFPIPALPLDAAPLSNLVTGLFREVGGFTEASVLEFRFYQFGGP